MLRSALAYARAGLRVFPVYEVDANGRCACAKDCGRDAGKHPRTRHGFKDATVDTSQILAWWTKWPSANVAIATGNGIAVVDVDTHGADGHATLAALEAAHGRLPETAEVATGGGGRHVYFHAPLGLKSGSLGPGVDLKAEGGYVVGPPSTHRSGRRYAWSCELPATLAELPEIPLWPMMKVAASVSPTGAANSTIRAATGERRYPAWLPDRLAVGIRHKTLVRLAGWLRGFGYEEGAIATELAVVVAERTAQPPDDRIDEGWLRGLARSMAAKPVARFGLRARYEAVANSWLDVAARMDRNVLLRAVLPMVARFRRLNGPDEGVPLPSLTVATMAGCCDRTASRSLDRLVRRRRVLAHAPGRARVEDAKRYRLRPPVKLSRTDEGIVATPVERSSTLGQRATLPAQDRDLYGEIFLHRGLGRVAEDVYKNLRTEVGTPVGALTKLAMCHRSSVYRALERMAEYGLVTQTPAGWCRCILSRTRLIEIATALGVYGRVAAEKARRGAQRVAYHSPAAQRRRDRDIAARRALQARVLGEAERQGWPRVGEVAGDRAWRAYVRQSKTRELWRALRRLTRKRRPARSTRSIAARIGKRTERQRS